MYETLMGKQVVVRSTQSGVWLGKLEQADGAAVRLTDARRAWSWSGAGSCSGLASVGPTDGKIALPVSQAVIVDCCEVLEATDAAVTAWKAVTPWSGR